jgi:hypothetical protein
MQGWSDSKNDFDKTLTKDQVLTNIMIYLVTDTADTAVWFYRGPLEEGPAPADARSKVPTGFTAFPAGKAYLQPPRVLLEKNFNLVHLIRKCPMAGTSSASNNRVCSSKTFGPSSVHFESDNIWRL